MPILRGDYGRVLLGSDQLAEVGSWWVELTGASSALKEWSGGFDVAPQESRVLASAFGSRDSVTLNLYLGDDDSETTYWTGMAFITHLPFGASAGDSVRVLFTGTGPFAEIQGNDRRML